MPEFLYEKYHPENAPYCSQFNKFKEKSSSPAFGSVVLRIGREKRF